MSQHPILNVTSLVTHIDPEYLKRMDTTLDSLDTPSTRGVSTSSSTCLQDSDVEPSDVTSGHQSSATTHGDPGDQYDEGVQNIPEMHVFGEMPSPQQRHGPSDSRQAQKHELSHVTGNGTLEHQRQYSGDLNYRNKHESPTCNNNVHRPPASVDCDVMQVRPSSCISLTSSVTSSAPHAGDRVKDFSKSRPSTFDAGDTKKTRHSSCDNNNFNFDRGDFKKALQPSCDATTTKTRELKQIRPSSFDNMELSHRGVGGHKVTRGHSLTAVRPGKRSSSSENVSRKDSFHFPMCSSAKLSKFIPGGESNSVGVLNIAGILDGSQNCFNDFKDGRNGRLSSSSRELSREELTLDDCSPYSPQGNINVAFVTSAD